MKSQIQLDLNAVIEGIAKLDLEDLETFASRINSLLAQKKGGAIPKKEATLLKKINAGLPGNIQEQYVNLLKKSTDGTLTENEHQKLLALIPQVEAKYAERLQYLIELAQFKNISVESLMDQLGITPPEDV